MSAGDLAVLNKKYEHAKDLLVKMERVVIRVIEAGSKGSKFASAKEAIAWVSKNGVDLSGLGIPGI